MARNFTEQDYELLSAYLDGEMQADERAAFESRLDAEADLRRELEALRGMVGLIEALPKLSAPRNFTLTPAMIRPARWLIFPATTAFSAAASAAAALLIVMGGLLLFQNSGSQAVPSHFTSAVEPQIALKSTEIQLLEPAGVALTATNLAELLSPPDMLGTPTLAADGFMMEEAESSTASGLANIPTQEAASDMLYSSEPADASPDLPLPILPAATFAGDAPAAVMAAPAVEAQGGAGGAFTPSEQMAETDLAQGEVTDEQGVQRNGLDESLTASPTAEATMTATPGVTVVAAAPTPLPAPVPIPGQISPPVEIWDLLPGIMIALGLVLIVIALGTTVARRRNR